MKFNILSIPNFDKQFKRLSKKYPTLKEDIRPIIENLKTNPSLGTPLGNDCYKIRISINSKGKGKSGGGRIITFLRVNLNSIYLLSILDKSEFDSISKKELIKLLSKITT
jgi:mRNA-degrading endonuclease RelE of RelBE toxin-antitoxin system